MSGDSDLLEQAYEGLECGECGDPISPGEWCGNDDCILGNEGPKTSRDEAEQANSQEDAKTTSD